MGSLHSTDISHRTQLHNPLLIYKLLYKVTEIFVHETREHLKISQKVNHILQQKDYLHNNTKENNPVRKKIPEQKIPLTLKIFSKLCNSVYDRNTKKKNKTQTKKNHTDCLPSVVLS